MTKTSRFLKRLRDEAKSILKMIIRRGPLTKADILDITKMKLSTLNRVMKPMEDEGFIVEYSVGESSGGRKPVLYGVNPNRYYLIGVDISRLNAQIILTNLKMEILDQKQLIMTNTSTPQEVVEWISEFVMEAIERLRIDKQMVIGIGVGTVGPLDRKKGIILNPKNFLSSGWNNVPIEEMLEKRLALPVIVDNGANMAALAEGFFGEGKDFNNIAYINCGAGIRTGAITLGSVVRAINDEEDAFGHMVVDFDGEICSCGNYGCVECYSSISAILKKFTSELKKGRSTIIEKTPEELDYEDICKAAARGDELAKETLVNAGTAFGIGLANYINLLNPQVVILSGPLIKHSELFFETCTGVAFKKNYLKYKNRIHFSRGGAFKENSIAVGAAASMIEELLSPEYDWENK